MIQVPEPLRTLLTLLTKIEDFAFHRAIRSTIPCRVPGWLFMFTHRSPPPRHPDPEAVLRRLPGRLPPLALETDAELAEPGIPGKHGLPAAVATGKIPPETDTVGVIGSFAIAVHAPPDLRVQAEPKARYSRLGA